MEKILAIDDNEINLELLSKICKIHYPNFQFLSATSGKEGIEIAIKMQPEVILLDIIMPGLNGFEVCGFLKNNNHSQHIPVIMISALGQNSDERTKGLNAGADAFISKPFNQSELRAQINVALRIKKVEDLLRKRNESLELFIREQTNQYLQNEERFLQISAHALEFYWEIDSKGIFTYISPVVEKMWNINPAKVVGKVHFLDFFQIDNLKGHKNKIEINFSDKTSFNDVEISLKLKSKEKIWLSVSGFSVFNENGEFYVLRGVCYDVTKRKQSEIELNKYVKQIKDYQKKLKGLNTELTLIEEKERRRIAENLHDSLGQTLSLAFIKLSSIAEQNLSVQTSNIIREASELLTNAITESRTLTYDLSPPILYELGLIPAFEWKLGQIEEKYSIKTRFNGDRNQIELQKNYSIFLYRIFSELIANIIKHAKANLIELNVKKGKNFYYITVQDDGVGFNTKLKNKASEKGGFGLLSINERLDSIKGRLLIDSEIGKGTKATVVIPY